MFEPAAVLRKVVPTWRARKVGLPSPLLFLLLSVLGGRESSQSAMYSGNGMERPATSAGMWEGWRSGLGNVVETMPVFERARRRLAIRVEVNHEG